jgi:2-keto-myo-inositol isomerase
MPTCTRRHLLLASTAATLAPVAAHSAAPSLPPFRYCLNMGTIRGLKLPVTEQVDVAAKAGYQAVELWIDELRKYMDQGGSLNDLRRRIADLGLSVEGSIGFTPWMVDDEAQRAAGLEQWKRELEMLAHVGCKRAAAPPSGATKTPVTDLAKIAARYRVLLEMGREAGVVPQLEFWGPSKSLSRLAEAAFVAVEAGHPDACLLLDAYQIYRGGSSFESVRLLNGRAVHLLHINDYPADPPRERLTDAHRVYPGDGVAPLVPLLRTLRETGFQGFLSLEVFNRDYWRHDALTVARTGLAKTRAVVEKALQGG